MGCGRRKAKNAVQLDTCFYCEDMEAMGEAGGELVWLEDLLGKVLRLQLELQLGLSATWNGGFHAL